MYCTNQRVAASHTGADGRLKLVSAIDMMQDCSQLWLESEPAVEAYFRENRISQMLVSRQVDVVRPPAYGERLEVCTSVYSCENVYGYRNTVIRDEAGGICYLSWSTGAFVSLQTGRPVRIPREIIGGVTLDPKAEMDYLPRRIDVPAGGRDLSPVNIRRQDIDFNRHMNNARYVEIAVELLPEDFAVSRLRVEYKLPVRPGGRLCPRAAESGDFRYILLLNPEGQVHGVMEFSGKEAL